MNDSCKFDIKFNPFKISVVFREWLNQKGALDDRGSFYEMLSRPINEDEKINNIIRILKNAYKNQFYTDDEEAIKIVEYVIKELQKKIPEFEFNVPAPPACPVRKNLYYDLCGCLHYMPGTQKTR